MRLSGLLLTSILTVSIPSSAQYVWTQKASIPEAEARYAATGFNIGTDGYLGTGYNSSNTTLSDWWKYDQVSNTWTQIASMTNSRFSAVSFAINGKGYSGLGSGPSGFLNDLQEYDPSTNSWTIKMSLPGAGRYGSTSFTISGKGYICGGNLGSATGPFTNELYEYDPISDSWTAKTPLPGANRYGSRAFVLNQKGYMFAGLNGFGNSMSQYLNDHWCYDPVPDTWTQKANFPGTVRNYTSAFVFDGMGVVGSGINSNAVTDDYYGYNELTDTWMPIPSIPGSNQRWAAVGFAIGNRGYISTGNSSFGTTVTNDLWEISLTTSLSTEPNQILSFQIYPNPTSDFLNIVLSNMTQDGLLLQITDITGKLVAETRLISKETKITTAEISEGIYIATVTDKSSSISATTRFLIPDETQ